MLSLYLQEYLLPVVNVLKNSYILSYLDKRDVFILNLSQNDEKIDQKFCCDNFSKFSVPLTCSLPKFAFKTGALNI